MVNYYNTEVEKKNNCKPTQLDYHQMPLRMHTHMRVYMALSNQMCYYYYHHQ
jgi:hypothetical protein